MMTNKNMLSIVPYFLRKSLGLNQPVVVKVDQRSIMIPIDLPGSLPNLFIQGNWKTNIISHFINLSDGAFIDVGANLGQTLIEFWIANNFRGRNAYFGFEPNQKCVEYLRSIINLNSLQKYQIYPVGLFNEAKEMSLYTQNDADACATVVEDLRPNRQYEVNEIVCEKFDDIFAGMNTDEISLIKIDVEGSELNVLQGMSSVINRLRPPILCEVLFTDKKADLSFMAARNQTLIELLNSWNYVVFQVIKNNDRSQVAKCQKISRFSSEFWSIKNMELCDYLFIPIEQEKTIANWC
jgi:FkbM family methyltransferase